jgi:hypothetical protein
MGYCSADDTALFDSKRPPNAGWRAPEVVACLPLRVRLWQLPAGRGAGSRPARATACAGCGRPHGEYLQPSVGGIHVCIPSDLDPNATYEWPVSARDDYGLGTGSNE